MSRLKLHADKFLLFIILLQIFYQFIETVMGFKSLVLILIFAILSVSCSTINFATEPNVGNRDYSMFNYLASKHNSTIFLLNGDDIEAEYVFVKNDSLHYVAVLDTLSVPLTTIERVEISQLGKKIASGFFMGIVTFFVSGFSAGAIYGDSLGGLLVGLTIGSALGLVALVLGTIYYGETEYIFNDKANYEQIEYYKNYHKIKAERDSTNLGS